MFELRCSVNTGFLLFVIFFCVDFVTENFDCVLFFGVFMEGSSSSSEDDDESPSVDEDDDVTDFDGLFGSFSLLDGLFVLFCDERVPF